MYKSLGHHRFQVTLHHPWKHQSVSSQVICFAHHNIGPLLLEMEEDLYFFAGAAALSSLGLSAGLSALFSAALSAVLSATFSALSVALSALSWVFSAALSAFSLALSAVLSFLSSFFECNLR